MRANPEDLYAHHIRTQGAEHDPMSGAWLLSPSHLFAFQPVPVLAKESLTCMISPHKRMQRRICSAGPFAVRRSIVAWVAYHGVRAAGRELGVQMPTASTCAALDEVQALTRDVALRVLWPCFKHSGQRGRA